MNQMSSDHSKLRTVLISQLGLHTDRFQRDNQITEAVGELINERNALRESHSMLAVVSGADSTKPSDIMKAVDTLRKERDERCVPDATHPQLSEIRYVLHGDIQPCSVLYSDDTTTLLRLDEGDIMCETDTIEWSDSVTYRCQELLRESGMNRVNLVRVSGHLAQLVRDERILLNDNGGNIDGAVTSTPFPHVVPGAPVVSAEPSCGNPYVHDNVVYPEAAMRNAGWKTEDLVQNGYGYYQLVPMQRSEER